MNVLYVTHTSQMSGGEIALLRMLKALQGSNVTPTVVLAENGPLKDELLSIGVQTQVIPASRDLLDVRKDSIRGPSSSFAQVWNTVRYAFRLRRFIKTEHIDLVHTNSLKSGLYGGIAARLAGVPQVWHLRDRLADDYLPRYAIVFMQVAISALATRAVCNSQSTLESLTSGSFGFLSKRTHAISSPLPDVFDASRVQHRDIEPEHDGLKYVMVGRLSPWKGQAFALEAFEQANIGTSTLTFIGSSMFGERDYVDTLMELQRQSPISTQLSFLGFVEDVASVLYEYDILIHASLSAEPFGQVVVEGLAAGLSVVAANAGGPAEIITTGLDGILYSPGNALELVDALELLHDDPALRSRLGKEGVRRARDFAPEKVARQVLDLYAACLESNH